MSSSAQEPHGSTAASRDDSASSEPVMASLSNAAIPLAVYDIVQRLPSIAAQETEVALKKDAPRREHDDYMLNYRDDDDDEDAEDAYKNRRSIEKTVDATPELLVLHTLDKSSATYSRVVFRHIPGRKSWQVLAGGHDTLAVMIEERENATAPNITLKLESTTQSALNCAITFTITGSWRHHGVLRSAISTMSFSPHNLEPIEESSVPIHYTSSSASIETLAHDHAYTRLHLEELRDQWLSDTTELRFYPQSQLIPAHCWNERLHPSASHRHGPYASIVDTIAQTLDQEAELLLLYPARASVELRHMEESLKKFSSAEKMDGWTTVLPTGGATMPVQLNAGYTKQSMLVPARTVLGTRAHILAAPYLFQRLEYAWTVKLAKAIDSAEAIFVTTMEAKTPKVLMLVKGNTLKLDWKSGKNVVSMNTGDRVKVRCSRFGSGNVLHGKVVDRKTYVSSDDYIIHISKATSEDEDDYDLRGSIRISDIVQAHKLETNLTASVAKKQYINSIRYTIRIEIFPEKHTDDRIHHNVKKVLKKLDAETGHERPFHAFCSGARPDRAKPVNALQAMPAEMVLQWRELIGDRPDQLLLIERTKVLPGGVCLLMGVPGSGKSEMLSIMLTMFAKSADSAKPPRQFRAIVSSSINNNLDDLAVKIRKRMTTVLQRDATVRRMYTRSITGRIVKLDREILKSIQKYRADPTPERKQEIEAKIDSRTSDHGFSDQRVGLAELAYSVAFALAERIVLAEETGLPDEYLRVRTMLNKDVRASDFYDAVDAAMPLVLKDTDVLLCSLALVNEPRVENHYRPDICVVDEASKAPSLEVMGLKAKHDKAILVLAGDPLQLGVHVAAEDRFNPFAAQERLPLFSRLAVLEWPYVFMTESQRFVPELCHLYSKLFYSGVMRPPKDMTFFDAALAKRRALLQAAELQDADWLCFNITGADEDRSKGPSKTNAGSAAACKKILRRLLKATTSDYTPSIAIITPFKAQASELIAWRDAEKSAYKGAVGQAGVFESLIGGVSISTVDTAQGDEWDILIIDVTATGRFMRFNQERVALTALTRAKTLLIYVVNFDKVRPDRGTIMHNVHEELRRGRVYEGIYNAAKKVTIHGWED